MSKFINVAIGSTMSKPGDVAGNLDQIASFARRAGADHADLLLTPEMSASGYGSYPEALATAEVAGEGPIYRELARLATETGVTLLAGFVEACKDKKYLAHYVVYPNGAFVVQRKHRRTPAEQPLDTMVELTHRDEADYIGQPVGPLYFNYFEVKGVRCGITICADGGIDNISRIFAENGVELMLGPAGAGGERKDRVTTEDLRTEVGRKKYLQVLEMVFFPSPHEAVIDCIKHGRAHAAINQCGYDGQKMYHLGHGVIINPMGEVLALVHGYPNIDRQKAAYTHAEIDVEDRLWAPGEGAQGFGGLGV